MTHLLSSLIIVVISLDKPNIYEVSKLIQLFIKITHNNNKINVNTFYLIFLMVGLIFIKFLGGIDFIRIKNCSAKAFAWREEPKLSHNYKENLLLNLIFKEQ